VFTPSLANPQRTVDQRPGIGVKGPTDYFMIRGLVSFSVQAAFLSTALLPSILGADIRFVPQKPGQNLMDWAHVEINGEIVQGDVEKLRKALAEFDRSIEEYAKAHENDKAYQQRAAAAGGIHGLGNMPVFLNSPGGSVPVALELGKVLRDSYAFTVVSCDGTCSSSCVFVLA
jgi:hypothetical protein